MVHKPKDTDYLYISTRLRSLENALLSRERMERMLEAKSNTEAAKILTECGYLGLEPLNEETLNLSLARHREEVFQEISEYCPNKHLVDVFRLKYDYHNAKVLLKCQATGSDPGSMLIHAGIYSTASLESALRGEEVTGLSPIMADALRRGQDILSTTQDARQSDFILDRACYEEMLRKAEASQADFLLGYLRLQIDVLNLRSAVRSLRQNKDMAFLKTALLPGGNVDMDQIISLCLSGESFSALFTGSLQEAAILGDAAKKGGRQTAFEKSCDNALCGYLKDCHMIPFGDAVVTAYLAAKENEITAARMILSGRLSGVDAASIRERLRDPYV